MSHSIPVGADSMERCKLYCHKAICAGGGLLKFVIFLVSLLLLMIGAKFIIYTYNIYIDTVYIHVYVGYIDINNIDLNIYR